MRVLKESLAKARSNIEKITLDKEDAIQKASTLKDGEIKLRRPHPITAEDLNRQIDRMPMRRREMNGGQS